MFEAIRARLAEIQDFEGNLVDAAIAVATELRKKVREGRRQSSRSRREIRAALRASGLSTKEAKRRAGKTRRGSGVSIEARVTGTDVALTASSQVQHLRRAQGETIDIVEAYRKHMTIGERWRAARGL